MSSLRPGTIESAQAAITFACTKCGRCCHDQNLPLTWDEAIAWLEDGGSVDLYCEADLWPSEPPITDLRAAHRKRRSFPAVCGTTGIRVTLILVASVVGKCRNLKDDMTCGIYERRPLVCRIYPAEINPFIRLDAARKACPPEAWQSGDILVTSTGAARPDVQSLVELSRQTDQDDTTKKDLLCRCLRLNVTALAGEGFIKYSPQQKTLLDALRIIRAANITSFPDLATWKVHSSRPATIERLSNAGVPLAVKGPEDTYLFLSA